MPYNEIMPGLNILGYGLLLKKSKTLIIGDLQLGYEKHLEEKGMLVPRFNFKEIMRELNEMFQKTGKLKRIIVNGDLKHEFGKISKQEWQEVIQILQLMKKKSDEVILVKGNHDLVLRSIAKWEKLKVINKYFMKKEKILVLHGDKLPDFKSKEFRNAKLLIVGHEHPAISLRKGIKKEKFKCFLKGNFKDKKMIVIPSMNSIAIGSDIINEELLSPFLKQDLTNFEVWIIEDKPYYFGKIKNIKMLE